MRNFLWRSVFVLVCVFLVNNLVIDFSYPTQLGEFSEVDLTGRFERVKSGEVTIVSVDELRSGGVGNFSAEAKGYVNMFVPEDVIYVEMSEQIYEKDKNYLFVHEYAHVLQKRLIADVSVGAPSRWNPLQSLVYYYNLFALNAALSGVVPPVTADVDGVLVVSGLEANADCVTQVFGSWPRVQSYIGSVYCSSEELAAAYCVVNGEWPSGENVARYKVLLDEKILNPLPVKVKGKG